MQTYEIAVFGFAVAILILASVSPLWMLASKRQRRAAKVNHNKPDLWRKHFARLSFALAIYVFSAVMIIVALSDLTSVWADPLIQCGDLLLAVIAGHKMATVFDAIPKHECSLLAASVFLAIIPSVIEVAVPQRMRLLAEFICRLMALGTFFLMSVMLLAVIAMRYLAGWKTYGRRGWGTNTHCWFLASQILFLGYVMVTLVAFVRTVIKKKAERSTLLLILIPPLLLTVGTIPYGKARELCLDRYKPRHVENHSAEELKSDTYSDHHHLKVPEEALTRSTHGSERF